MIEQVPRLLWVSRLTRTDRNSTDLHSLRTETVDKYMVFVILYRCSRNILRNSVCDVYAYVAMAF